jgi:hypothetical protein
MVRTFSTGCDIRISGIDPERFVKALLDFLGEP